MGSLQNDGWRMKLSQVPIDWETLSP
jgi:hypothetical protein